MKFNSKWKCNAGLTLMQMMILTVIAALLLVFLSRYAKAHSRSQRISCVSDLKATGIAFRGFGIDKGGGFPMHVKDTNAPPASPPNPQ